MNWPPWRGSKADVSSVSPSIPSLVIGWFFRFCFRLQQSSFQRNRKKWKRFDSSDSDSVDFRFSLGRKISYDFDYDSDYDCVASEKQPLLQLIHWIAIYPVDGVIQPLNGWGQKLIHRGDACAAFSPALAFNWFRWRIRDEQPRRVSSARVTRKRLAEAKYRGLRTS